MCSSCIRSLPALSLSLRLPLSLLLLQQVHVSGATFSYPATDAVLKTFKKRLLSACIFVLPCHLQLCLCQCLRGLRILSTTWSFSSGVLSLVFSSEKYDPEERTIFPGPVLSYSLLHHITTRFALYFQAGETCLLTLWIILFCIRSSSIHLY